MLRKIAIVGLGLTLCSCGAQTQLETSQVTTPTTVSTTTTTIKTPSQGEIDTFLNEWKHQEETAALRYIAITTQPTATVQKPAPVAQKAVVKSSAPTSTGSNSYLNCVRNRESRGQYNAVNSSSGAGGAYQFLQSTWNNTARHAGRNDLVGTHPSAASPADQDAMAQHLMSWMGASPWSGPGC